MHAHALLRHGGAQACSPHAHSRCARAHLCVRPCRNASATLDAHTVASGKRSSTVGMRPLWSGSVWLTKM